MHELRNATLRSALEKHLKKWYPESVSSNIAIAGGEEIDSGGVPVAPISFEATKIDVSNVFRLEATKAMKEMIEELKNESR